MTAHATVDSGPRVDLTGTVGDLLAGAAGRWPGHTALSDGRCSVTWAGLAARAGSAAARLTAAGAARGDRVLIHVSRPFPVPAWVFGAARAGAAFVVLHPQTRGGHLEHALDDSEPAVVVTDDDGVRAAATARGVPVLDPEPDSEPGPGVDPAPVPVLPVDLACLIYTSGTTSMPKAVVSTHAQVVFAATAIQSVLRYRPDDVVFAPLPLSFDYGLYQLFLAACGGAQVRLAGPDEIGPALPAELERAGATVLAAVPTVADALARLLARSGRTLPHLRAVTSTGAAMAAPTLRTLRDHLPDARMHVMFGLTECKRATIMPADGDLDRPGSSGRALPGTEVYAADPDGRRLPPGDTGELVVRGPNVMAGYWRRPELTAERFPRARGLLPELRTGDYGRCDADGFVWVDGRRDDVYKVNGFRVSCSEVEAAALRVPGVRAAAVLAPADGLPARLFVVGDRAPGEVLDGLRRDLEDVKVPGACHVLERLPLTRNGKVDRARLVAEATGVG